MKQCPTSRPCTQSVQWSLSTRSTICDWPGEPLITKKKRPLRTLWRCRSAIHFSLAFSLAKHKLNRAQWTSKRKKEVVRIAILATNQLLSSIYNGDEGNRTPVQIPRHNQVYANSLVIWFSAETATRQAVILASLIISSWFNRRINHAYPT